MKDLEQEKDALWSGLEVLEKGRLWYFQRLEENRALRCVETRYSTGAYHKRAAEVQGHALLRKQTVDESA